MFLYARYDTDSMPREVPDDLLCPLCFKYGEERSLSSSAPTDEENKEHGCGRPYACCAYALACPKCKFRVAFKRAAPEMAW
jgi:hypothetical protein